VSLRRPQAPARLTPLPAAPLPQAFKTAVAAIKAGGAVDYRADGTSCIGRKPFAIAVAAAFHPETLLDEQHPENGFRVDADSGASVKVEVVIEQLAIISVQVGRQS
jgi:hypothetical protein